MTLAQQWGRAIRTQRILHEISQEQLAQACGVSQATVSRWEKGIHTPSHFHIPTIAATLGTVPSILFQYPQAA